MSTDEIYEVVGWTLSIVAVVGLFAGCIIWLISQLRNAPTEVESTPLDDLLGPVYGPPVSVDEMRARVLGEPCIDPDCANCAVPPPAYFSTGDDALDEHFASAMRMLNNAMDEAMDPMVERIVAKVHEVIAAAEAVELEECAEEFLADPMNFGRP